MDPNISIDQIMTKTPVTVNPSTSLARIAEIFEDRGFHHLPVVDGSKLVGIISKQDYLQVKYVLARSWDGEITTSDAFQDFCADDIMTEYPMQLNPDDSVGLAADIFLSNKFHALPIVDDGDLVGIITAHDLISFAFSSPIDSVS